MDYENNEIYEVEETTEVESVSEEASVSTEYRKPSYKKVIFGIGLVGTIAAAIAIKNRDKIKAYRRKQAKKYLEKTGGLFDDEPAEVTGNEIDVDYAEIVDEE